MSQCGVSMLTIRKVLCYEVFDYFGIQRFFDTVAKAILHFAFSLVSWEICGTAPEINSRASGSSRLSTCDTNIGWRYFTSWVSSFDKYCQIFNSLSSQLPWLTIVVVTAPVSSLLQLHRLFFLALNHFRWLDVELWNEYWYKWSYAIHLQRLSKMLCLWQDKWEKSMAHEWKKKRETWRIISPKSPSSTAATATVTCTTVHPAVTNGLPKIRVLSCPSVLIPESSICASLCLSAKSCAECRARKKAIMYNTAPRMTKRSPTLQKKEWLKSITEVWDMVKIPGVTVDDVQASNRKVKETNGSGWK